MNYKKKAKVRFHIFRMFEFLKLFRNYGIIVKKKKEEKRKGRIVVLKVIKSNFIKLEMSNLSSVSLDVNLYSDKSSFINTTN